MVKKMFIEIRLCNLTDVFKGHTKFAKKFNVPIFKGHTKFAKKFNVPILNRLKIMVFL